MSDIAFYPAHRLAGMIRSREIGSLELLESLPGADRALQSGAQRHHLDGCRGRQGARGQGRCGAGEGRDVGAAAWAAHDHQGILRSAGLAHDLGHSRHAQQHLAQQFGGGPAAAECGRGHLRQDQRAAAAGRLAELQRDLRHDEQSLGSDQDAGRLLRRFVGSARRGIDRTRTRLRYRRLDPQPRALLRRAWATSPPGASCRPAARRSAPRSPNRISPSQARWPARWRIWPWRWARLAGPDTLDEAGWRLVLPKPKKTKLADYRIAVHGARSQLRGRRGICRADHRARAHIGKGGRQGLL